MTTLLSPGINTTETNFGYSVGSLPSSNTFSVLRADKGEAFILKLVTTEDEQVKQFGKPTSYNYLDWFNTKNFYDYASSMYIVRPIDSAKATKNVGMALSGGTSATLMTVNEGIGQSNLFNQTTAEGTLSSLVTDSHTKILAVGSEDTSTWTMTMRTMMGADDYQLTQKGVSGADSAILTINSVDSLGIIGSDPNWDLELLNDTYLQGWGIDTGTIPFTDGVAFVIGEVVTGGTSGATGTVTAVGSNQLTLSGVTNGGTGADVFGGSEAISGNISGTGTACGELILDQFIATDATGTVTFTGAITSSKLTFYNRYVTYDQRVGVAICSDTTAWSLQTSTTDTNLFSSYFEYEPVWANSEFALLVYEQEDDSTWTQKEKYVVNYLSTGKDVYGRTNFVEDVLLNADSRVFCKVGSTGAVVDTSFGPMPEFRHNNFDTIYPRTGDVWPSATQTSVYAQGDIEEAFDLIDDSDTSDIGLILQHYLSQNYASTIAATRLDAFAIVAPFDHTELVGKSSDDGVTYLTGAMGTVDYAGGDNDDFSGHNTYTGIFGNMKYIFDRYNDTNRWVPIHGDVAGIMAETDRLYFPWYAPAGLNRGKIRNAIKLAFNPNKTGRDNLYVNGINIVYAIPGEGQGVVWGQKTATSIASIFSRINVRRLMITIEKEISKSMRPYIMEFSDEKTWNQILGTINPYLSNVRTNRGLEDFLVICDATNNTAEIINQNLIVVDIFVKPQQVAEFIQLNFAVTKSGVAFSELI